MRRVMVVLAFVLVLCIVLALLGARLRGRHGRGVVVARLAVGVPLFVVYAYGVLSLTVLGRATGTARTANLELFWSHRESLALVDGTLSVTDSGLLNEIVLNVLLFVPLGALLAFVLPGLVARGRAMRGLVAVCLVACACSLGIEVTQWYLRLGLFEFDDLLHNTLGAAVGYALYWAVFRASTRRISGTWI